MVAVSSDLDYRLDRLQTELARLREQYPQLATGHSFGSAEDSNSLTEDELAMLRRRYSDLDWSYAMRPSVSTVDMRKCAVPSSPAYESGAYSSRAISAARPHSARSRSHPSHKDGRALNFNVTGEMFGNTAAGCFRSKTMRPQSEDGSSPCARPSDNMTRPLSCGGWNAAGGSSEEVLSPIHQVPPP